MAAVPSPGTQAPVQRDSVQEYQGRGAYLGMLCAEKAERFMENAVENGVDYTIGDITDAVRELLTTDIFEKLHDVASLPVLVIYNGPYFENVLRNRSQYDTNVMDWTLPTNIGVTVVYQGYKCDYRSLLNPGKMENIEAIKQLLVGGGTRMANRILPNASYRTAARAMTTYFSANDHNLHFFKPNSQMAKALVDKDYAVNTFIVKTDSVQRLQFLPGNVFSISLVLKEASDPLRFGAWVGFPVVITQSGGARVLNHAFDVSGVLLDDPELLPQEEVPARHLVDTNIVVDACNNVSLASLSIANAQETTEGAQLSGMVTKTEPVAHGSVHNTPKVGNGSGSYVETPKTGRVTFAKMRKMLGDRTPSSVEKHENPDQFAEQTGQKLEDDALNQEEEQKEQPSGINMNSPENQDNADPKQPYCSIV